MELADLEQLKNNINIKINSDNIALEEIKQAILNKKIAMANDTLKFNPYYKDKMYYIRVDLEENHYVVNKLKPNGMCPCYCQFNENSLEFLKYYTASTKSEWDTAIDTFNSRIVNSKIKLISE